MTRYFSRCAALAVLLVLMAAAVFGAASEQAPAEHVCVGEGANEFIFTVTDGEGLCTSFDVHTDCTLVGEALEQLGLIAGEEGPYGLYVLTVNGQTADYNMDGHYWAFYVNGEYAMAGVDRTDIVPGDVYGFVLE